MNGHYSSAQANTKSDASTPNTSDTRVHGPWLVTARIGWVTITLIGLLIFVLSIPAYFAQLHVICTATSYIPCINGTITPGNALVLTHLGISLDVYIAYILTITLAASLVFLTVGAIIFWRKSRELIGLFVSLLLIIFGCCGSTLEFVEALSAAHPDWVMVQIISNDLGLIIYPALGMLFCIFPDGRFVPRWSWLSIGLWIISAFCFNAPLDSPFYIGNWPPVLFAAFLLLTFGVGLGFQIYRYRYVSRPEQRQQTKWFVFACFITIVLNILYYGISELVPAFNQPDSLYQLASATVTVFPFIAIPLAIGVAILRYRLWDIDILINRTLVYGLLSAILLLTYLVLVFAGQHLLVSLLGQSNGVVLVGSTLIVAALFQPLRQGVQRLVDRRFYRSKYDAAKIVAAFSATLRQEVDLDQLHDHLLAVVQETMQPAQVSLWLRKPEQDGKRSSGKE